MDQSRILILGAGGQLGRALTSKFPGAKTASHQELDITDFKAMSLYAWQEVDVILNAAAYTKVDLAETPEGRREAWAANGTAVANLARIATANGQTLVHISSEYVFDGENSPHTEDEPLSPLSTYGASKAAGDIAAQATPKHYVIRTSWVIGEGGNFVRTMAGLAAKNISPTVVDDQIGRLTFASTLADSIALLLDKKAAFGVYNVTDAGEPASWAGITQATFTALGRSDLTVSKTTTTAYFADKPAAAKRPLNSTLDLSKIQGLGFEPRDWRVGLTEYVKTLKEI